ncbi:1-deoxy-D-xylulose-5-phosphate synthase [bacterium]|nr:MAG: 1-deoxy-D-xylulose-5-phosphate synthase [bacterium]
MSLLEQISSPAELKNIDTEKFSQLAQELRDFIISSVSATGGHLAPSLGVIELTIALLYVYSPPEDKIIWDVGHQSYAYKILTGRREKFHTLRQLGGISGFNNRSESQYDAWGVGHASTSISAALGFAMNRDLAGQNHNVVAIIGDGALTGGLAFEGLNNAGASGTEMLVILNDNTMSISKNVGAVAKYLTDIVASPFYQKVKSEIWDITGKAGELGKYFRTIARKMEDSLKNLIVPGMLFEQFGFEYYGPIDGHDTGELIRVLREIKDIKKPKLLHIITKKGKGFQPAEKDATKFHGLGKFNISTGEVEKETEKPTYTKIFGAAMVELGEKFKDLCATTAAMEIGTGLSEFHKKFPERFFDVGIAENHAVVFSAALAAEGRRTVAAIYSTFMQRAYDAIIHDVALQKIPLVLAMDRAGIVGEDGPTHHGIFDISYLRAIPNIIIAAPSSGTQLRNLIFTALDDFSNTWAIRYPRSTIPDEDVEENFERIEIGSWEILKRGSGELLVLAVGSMVHPALEAAQNFSENSITVVDCRFVKPMDEEMLFELLKSHEKVITIEEGSLLGGFGEGVAAFAQEKNIFPKFLKNIGIPDEFITFGKRDELLKMLSLDTDGIFKQLKSILQS